MRINYLIKSWYGIVIVMSALPIAANSSIDIKGSFLTDCSYSYKEKKQGEKEVIHKIAANCTALYAVVDRKYSNPIIIVNRTYRAKKDGRELKKDCLILRAIRTKDAAALHRLFIESHSFIADYLQFEYQKYGSCVSKADELHTACHRKVRRSIRDKQYSATGSKAADVGVYLLEDKHIQNKEEIEENTFMLVGMVGLHSKDFYSSGSYDGFYLIGKRYKGKGIAHTALLALMGDAFYRDNNLDQIILAIWKDNLPSRGLAHKLKFEQVNKGMNRKDTQKLYEGGFAYALQSNHEFSIYEMTRKQYDKYYGEAIPRQRK